MELKLSSLKLVKIEQLKSNPLNQKFFNPTSGAEYDWLFQDIKKRGIIDPLIAKKDKMLLTGHRRLSIAKQLSLETIPVRFIEEELTKEQEEEFLIKDNILRRHMEPTERKKLYYYLIPNFDELLENTNSKTMGIDRKELAQKTGLNPRTVGYDLSQMRHKAKKKRIQESVIDLPDEKAIKSYKKACATMLNIAILGSKITLEEFKKIHQATAERLENIIH